MENAWAKTREQIIFVESIAPSLDAEHRRVLDNSLAILATKLSLAVAKVQGVLKTDKGGDARPGFLRLARRVRCEKYAFAKASLDEVIRDMEDSQGRFDPSWYLIMRMASPLVDRELNRVVQKSKISPLQSPAAVGVAVRPGQRLGLSGAAGNSGQGALLTADGVRDALRPNPQHHISTFLPQQDLETIDIRYSSAKVARRKGTAAGPGSTKWFINSIRCLPSSDVTKLTRDVRDLARKLTQADPLRFGLLSCKGVVRVLEPTTQRLRSFDMIFRAPDENNNNNMSRFQCLRESLLCGEDTTTTTTAKTLSLSRRVRIAQELAKSVSHVHTFNFVHKNIRPESILIVDHAGADADSSRWCSTFLVGFRELPVRGRRHGPGRRRRMGPEAVPASVAAGREPDRAVQDAARHIQPRGVPARDRRVGTFCEVRDN